MEIKDLNLTNATLVRLQRNGVFTTEQLTAMTPSDVLSFRWVGATTLADIISSLNEKGLSLAEETKLVTDDIGGDYIIIKKPTSKKNNPEKDAVAAYGYTLKPCPFCGGVAKSSVSRSIRPADSGAIHYSGNAIMAKWIVRIFCRDCHAKVMEIDSGYLNYSSADVCTVPPQEYVDKAVRRWNSRAT